MEMNQIRYFLAVCEHQNFTHAARSSNVSQPSLTAAIKKLEAELEGTLFLRDRAGCRLTALGRLIQPRLESILQQAQEAKADAVRHVRLDRVPISVGVGETIGPVKITEAIERYRQRLPEADIELISDNQRALLKSLREGLLDLVITPNGEVSNDLYRKDHLYQESYKVVVAENHPLSKHKALTLGQLANTMMLDRPNCEMREQLHQHCADQGHNLYATYRSNRVEWLLDLARQGSGAVILPATAITNEPALVALPLDDLSIEREVIALRSRHQPTRPEAQELIREITRSQ
ncbi:MAG: LysR family transcriptional regulator [Pseudomonadales bacterium]